MEVETTANNRFAQNITFIVVSFGGANIAPFEGKPPTYLEEYFQGVILHKTNDIPKNLGIYSDTTFAGSRTITWLTQGYYYPTITVHYNDSTTIDQPLKDYTVHVYSQDFSNKKSSTKST